jgi:hypothetical protein
MQLIVHSSFVQIDPNEGSWLDSGQKSGVERSNMQSRRGNARTSAWSVPKLPASGRLQRRSSHLVDVVLGIINMLEPSKNDESTDL